MQDQSYHPLGHLDGAEVGVRPTLDGQDILIQQSEMGRNLANLLAAADVQFVQQGSTSYWRIPHSHEVDRLLRELTDLFISIRYAHPTLVQLELVLNEAGGLELGESVS
jgi:hypothetical protein